MAVIIEARPYGPDSTPDEVEALRGCVRVVAEQVILMREIPVQTPFSLKVMDDRVDELAAGWQRFGQVVDLRVARRPDAEARAVLKQRLLSRRGRLAHLAVVTGTNVVIAAVAKLVAYAVQIPLSVHVDTPGAIEAAQRAVPSRSPSP